MAKLRALLILSLAGGVFGQAPTAPVLNPRGAVNAFTVQPAPSSVSAGGILTITGINLGPAAGFTAEAGTLPTSIGDPALEVRINNRPSPIYAATPGSITVQVPLETANGAAQVVVRRGTQASQPARFNVVGAVPSVRTANGNGYGTAGESDGAVTKLRATGLGLTDPRVATGELPAADQAALLRAPIRATVGGLPAEATAQLSATNVGEFEVAVALPADSLPTDVVAVYLGNAVGNRVTLGAANSLVSEYLPLPANARDPRGLAASDLRPGYLTLSGARGEDGCWPSWLVDFSRRAVQGLGGCAASANRNAATPFQANNEAAAVAAFVGPAAADIAQGVSDKLTILHPANAEPMTVTLPAAGLALAGAQGGNVGVLLATTPPRNVVVNPITGEITEGAAGAGPGGGGGGINISNLAVDLGDGVKELVAVPVNVGQGALAVLAVDSAAAPTKAKFGLVGANGQATSTQDFPSGWLPLLAPVQAAGPGGGLPGIPGLPGLPGIPGGGGIGGAFALIRGATFFDGQTRLFWTLARNPQNTADAFIAFSLAPNTAPVVLPLGDGIFVASCTAQTRLFTIDLTRRIAVSTGTVAEKEVKNPCAASSFALLDLTARQLTTINLPGQGQFSVSGNSANEMNDYVYGTNADPARQGRSDTIYVLDGVGGSAFRLDLPPEISTFANPTPYPEMSLLVAQATAQNSNVNGGAGLVLFDIENQQARLLPTPAGFSAVQLLSIFPTTRKLLARGTRVEPVGSQLLVYDMITGDLQVVANPPGVVWAGPAPVVPTPGQPPQQQAQPLQHFSPRSNAVHVVGYGADRRAAGVMLLRIN
ncbi:MAG: IPT/TIG domain-containing protein [Acidobacteria bacterium]|nr:IPT/TIG domain-containing protein [Acidobacteriota bacterium]